MQWFDSDQMIREIAMENRQNDEDAQEPEESDEAWKARQNSRKLARAPSSEECYRVDINNELRGRCARLNHVWLPGQRVRGIMFTARIFMPPERTKMKTVGPRQQ